MDSVIQVNVLKRNELACFISSTLGTQLSLDCG